MKVADFNRLKKFMAMTFSEADAEALMALRQANKVLAGCGIDWERVLTRCVTLEVEPDPSSSHTMPGMARSDSQDTPGNDQVVVARRRYLNDLLANAEENARGSWADFVASLREQFDDTGSLSTLQVEALEKSARRDRR